MHTYALIHLDSSPSTGEDSNVNGQKIENDDEIKDLPSVSSEGTITANESEETLTANEDSDCELSPNHNTVNIELQFDEEEAPRIDTFPKEDSLSKMQKCVTSIPLGTGFVWVPNMDLRCYTLILLFELNLLYFHLCLFVQM